MKLLSILLIAIGLNTMPDEKLLEAYKMARQMDSQTEESQDFDQKQKLDEFLNAIGMIESSGGQNFAHDEIQSGIHKGHRAAGTYGLMPNTVQEVLNIMRTQGEMPEQLASLNNMNPDEVKQYIEQNPEAEKLLASNLAQRVLERQGGDEEKAAYSWFQGHNLSPEEIEKRDYQKHDYVNKYKKYRGK